MNYRHVELLGLKTISADQTEIIDIDLADPISEIILDVEVKNGAIAASTGHPVESVIKIEIIDGSEVLWSLSGMCAHALDIYCTGIHPRGGWFQYLPSNVTEFRIALDFGRYLFDPILAFVPPHFTNPQLKITHDVSAGGTNPSECKLNVNALVFDEKTISPMGMLTAKEIKTWTGSSGTYEYTDLPTDLSYRKLLIQALLRGTPPHWSLDNIKLNEDQDKRVLFNDHFRDLMFGIGRENAYIRETLICGNNGTALNRHITPSMDVVGNATAWAAAAASDDYSVYDGDGGRLAVRSSGATSCQVELGGWSPHSVICLPFGDQKDPDDWYDVSRVGSLKLEVKAGSSSVNKVFIQQLKKY